jgi:hypothetical protein
MDLNKVVDKLKKLMRHQASAAEIGSQAEAEAFAARIHALAEEYNVALSEVSLEDQSTGDNDVINRELRFKDAFGDLSKGKSELIPKWVDYLTGTLTHFHGCKSITRANTVICVIGPAIKVELVTYLLLTLGRAARRLAAERGLFLRRMYGTAGPGFEENFLMGFVGGIGTQLKRREEEAAAARASSVTALVLRKEAEISAVIERDFGKVEPGTKYRGPSNKAAYSEGLKAGLSADVDGHALRGGEAKVPAQIN